MLGTKAQYAAHRGCSRPYLSKPRVKAMLEPAMEIDPADGVLKINFEKADEIFAATRNPEKYIGRGGEDRPEPEGPRPDSYEEARRQLTLTRLERDRMDLAARKLETLDRKQVDGAVATMGQMIREGLEMRSRDLADRAAPMTDPAAIEAMIEEADRILLNTVINELRRKLHHRAGADQPTTTH